MTRRGFLTAAGGIAVAGAGYGARSLLDVRDEKTGVNPVGGRHVAEPFFGKRQSGILTPSQTNTYFAAFDIVSDKKEDVIAMLKRWTEATARMTGGQTLGSPDDVTKPAPDSGETLGMAPARLSVTFGFGASLFTKDGKDRFGLAHLRPQALVDMPKFNGDQIVEARSNGDISVQACADDPQVAFHAIRQLARLANDVAVIRWTQTGFVSRDSFKETPRNLMGFKDGTQSPAEKDNDKVIWVGEEGPDWLRGGSYVVVRRIRMALEHWDNSEVDFQEQVIGRYKYSGAPLGKRNEFDVMDLNAVDKDGNLVIPDNAHIRLASAAANDGAQILRRGYSYNDGVNFIAERWPPWRQGLEYDAGLLFICYQKDPRTGFIKIFENMSKLDALNQFVTHTTSGLYACPGGVAKGEYIGQRLFSV